MVTRLEVLRVTRFLWALSVPVFLLQDVRRHTARQARKLLQQFGWKALDDPRYSPNLVPSDIHIFSALIDNLPGRRFI